MQLTVIQQKIYEVRAQKIMLDFDLAELYEVETRALNQAIKRNLESFPPDFMFRLTAKEWKELPSSQIVMMDSIPKNRTGRYLPYAFTEHGVTMLASVLKSSKARKMNIAIVRAFIFLKKFALDYKELAEKIARLEKKYNRQFKDIYEALNLLLDEKQNEKDWKERDRIGFK